MSRLTLAGAIVVAALAWPTYAANRVRVFVPANDYHGEQQLVVGQTGEIYIEITNDIVLSTIAVNLGLDNPGGGRLWNPLSGTNAEFMLAGGSLPIRNLVTMRQRGDWPDTVTVSASGFMPTEHLLPGSRLFAKLRVTPTAAGTIVISDVNDGLNGFTQFIDNSSVRHYPEYLADSITVIQLADCNGNGVPDVQELAEGTALDCNFNNLPDECDIAEGRAADCNANGVPDVCDIVYGGGRDCNLNLIPDECDPDLNFNGIVDECDTLIDCNFNGMSDATDINNGFSSDVNGNGKPDECEGLAGNFIRIYTPPGSNHQSQELESGQTGQIVIAVVNSVEIMGASVSFRFNSGDGNPLWAPVTADNMSFLAPNGPGDYEFIGSTRLGGNWPDTLTVMRFLFQGGNLPVGTHPLFSMTVTPTGVGVVTWESAPVPWGYLPPQFSSADGETSINVGLVAPPLSIRYCCNGRVGDVNGEGGDEPTIGDISTLIDHLFVSGVGLSCLTEADVNQSGGVSPNDQDITIGDISTLIDYLFVGGGNLPNCY